MASSPPLTIPTQVEPPSLDERSPAAIVWHHRRGSVRAFWRQQVGYGASEAMLEEKHPERYNSVGHHTWGGRVYGARVLLLVGPGDNGGDALWAGAMLARRGAAVEAVLLADKAHQAGLAALRDRGGRVVTVEEAHTPDVVVDGIVGIGGRPGLRDAAAAACCRRCRAQRISGISVRDR